MSRQPSDFSFQRFHVDLEQRTVRRETVACTDLEDVLGGIARGFKLLADRPVADAYAPDATLILNLGILSGSDFMTGLRTFFHAYSPLKSSDAGAPAPMWTAGSGKFGTKLRHLGIDEVLFTGTAKTAMLLHLSEGEEDGPEFEFLDAGDLCGQTIHDKIMAAHERWPEAHVAAIGPAGENFEAVRCAAIGLSTINELRSGDNKPRFCGRGGIGGVMGSKNLLAIVADIKDPKTGKPPDVMKEINGEVARGKGSARFRDKKKNDPAGGGGTWANYEGLGPVNCVPEYNFVPAGRGESDVLHRPAVEADGKHVVKAEACYRCGIRCHKNVYDKGDDGKPGEFRAKLDYEPLNLLSSNLGIFDADQACELVELVDLLGMDSISIGVTLAYAMEYNRRHPDAAIANGITYGDYEGTLEVIEEIGRGRMPQLGQGTRRLAAEVGEPGYAMHCKGVEFPAYLPQINPGYPFALAGGHMSMATYLLYVYEKETGEDYWVDAITRRGIKTMRDDIIGICKFSGMKTARVCEALEALNGLAVDPKELDEVVLRTYLRGYRAERDQGFTDTDYDMPAECHELPDAVDMPHFNTKEFFDGLKTKVLDRFDQLAAERSI